jgi:death-on-curing protein
MRWLQLAEVLELHRRLIDQTGGTAGIRDLGLQEASLAQPRQTFGGIDLYPDLIEKAAAMGFSLIQNHPFVDGNKRIGTPPWRSLWSPTELSLLPPWIPLKLSCWLLRWAS